MTGELYMRGYDVYREFGVTPLKGTFDEVMRPATVKAPLTVEIENQDGEEVYFPDNETLQNPREFTMPVALVAYNANDFLDKKRRFENLLRRGTLFMYIPSIDLGMTCYLQDFTQYTQLEDIQVGQSQRVSAKLQIKMREPNPSKRGLSKEENSYGVQIDELQSNPNLTRIGNLEMAKEAVVNELVMQGTLKNGYLRRFKKDNGLRYEDNTPSITDGSAGNVMSHMPGFYFRVEDVTATKHNLYVSPYPIEGFMYHPGWTIGSFKANVNNTAVFGRPQNSLWSVVNTSTTFRGGDNDPTNDALQKGFLGKARTDLTRTQFYNYAQNQGTDFGLIPYSAHQGLMMLFYTKYGTLDSQKPIESEKDAQGFYQGGLGDGVTTVSSGDWDDYNGNFPLIETGVTLDYGVQTGEVAVTLTDFNLAGDVTVYQNTFMGIESPFGDLYEWTGEINIWKQTVGEGDKYMAYIYDNHYYEDTIGGNHTRSFEFSKSEGWLKSIQMGANFEVMIKEADNGASSSTHFTDYFYNNDSLGVRGLRRGAKANYGSRAGLSCAYTLAPSYSNAYFASRLGYFGKIRPLA